MHVAVSLKPWSSPLGRSAAQRGSQPAGLVPCSAAQRGRKPVPCKSAAIDDVTNSPWQKMSHAERQDVLKLFTPKHVVKPFVQLDHTQRRRDKEIGEIADAARRVGLSRQTVDENVARLEKLLPDLAPNLDKMKASDWVALIRDVDRVAVMLVMLKSYYPGANLSRIISRNPKILLQDMSKMKEDAQQVRSLLGDKLPNLDAIIEECPDLMRPAQAALSINNLKRWFPKQDPYELLQKNPALLNNIDEADTKPDPTYGWESNYFNTGSVSQAEADVIRLDL